MGKLMLLHLLLPPCWRLSQGLRAHENQAPEEIGKRTGAGLIEDPRPKILENPAGATLCERQRTK